MMFLLRVAVCLALVALFLPGSQTVPAANEAQIGPGEAFIAANAAFADMRQFCSRQADACAVGSRAALVLGQKAQATAKMAFEYLSSQIGQEANGAPAAASRAPSPNTTAAERARNTLTEADRALPWRGQHARPALLAKDAS